MAVLRVVKMENHSVAWMVVLLVGSSVELLAASMVLLRVVQMVAY